MRGHDVFDLNNLEFGVVISDFSDFAEEELCAVARQVMSSNMLAPNEWKCVVKENSDNEIRTFYSKSRYYTYEIMRLYLQPGKFRKKGIFAEIVRSLRNIPETGNVLEFGGGTGQLCLIIFFIFLTRAHAYSRVRCAMVGALGISRALAQEPKAEYLTLAPLGLLL